MDHFLTRHAIFDRESKVYAYEVSFRSDLENLAQKRPKEDQKASKVLTESFFTLGIDSITSGKRAFVRFTKNLLISEFALMFPKESIAVIIGDEIPAEGKIIAAVKDLKENGYLLVLDNFSFNQNSAKLTPFADMVIIDNDKTGDFIKKSIVKRLQPQGIKCIIKNVETQAAYYKVFPQGFDYFQGDFFSKPALVEKKDVPVSKFNFLEMLKEITRPEFDFNKIENIVKRDVSLTFKLLKMINSSAYGIKNEVKSIKQALVLLGANEVKKWVTLVILSNIGDDKPDELMKKALVRAKFLELISPAAGFSSEASDIFLVGMFSLMDTLMGQPLDSILGGLPLSDEIKNALLGGESPYKNIFQLVLSYEEGEWDKVKSLAAEAKIEEDPLPAQYKESIEWVNKISL
jgi:EAL and modified HD-GYP domain-containing signal transduction protein